MHVNKKLVASIGTITLGMSVMVACGANSKTSSETSKTATSPEIGSDSATNASANNESVQEDSETSISVSESVSTLSSTTGANDPVASEGNKDLIDSSALEGKKIACVVKGMNSNYWKFAAAGSNKAAEDYGITVDILSPTTADNNEQQLQLMEQAVAKQYDVICLAPADSSGIIPGIQQANEAGIPVILYTNSVSDDTLDILDFLRVDDHDSQYKSTYYMCEQMKSGTCILLTGTAGAQNSKDKQSGAEDAVAEFPDIEIVATQAANWSSTDGYTVTQNLLQSYPDITGVIACNDQMAAGALQALAEVGKDDGSIYMCGMNCDAVALQAVKDGLMTNTLDNMPYDLGYLAVQRACEYLSGVTLAKEETLNTTLCTPENVDEIIQKQKDLGLFDN